jgi:predicted nuclease of predicted toxin-antitoxin system
MDKIIISDTSCLPFRLAKSLKDNGFDILHTDDLPDKERTTDKEINNEQIIGHEK